MERPRADAAAPQANRRQLDGVGITAARLVRDGHVDRIEASRGDLKVAINRRAVTGRIGKRQREHRIDWDQRLVRPSFQLDHAARLARNKRQPFDERLQILRRLVGAVGDVERVVEVWNRPRQVERDFDLAGEDVGLRPNPHELGRRLELEPDAVGLGDDAAGDRRADHGQHRIRSGEGEVGPGAEVEVKFQSALLAPAFDREPGAERRDESRKRQAGAGEILDVGIVLHQVEADLVALEQDRLEMPLRRPVEAGVEVGLIAGVVDEQFGAEIDLHHLAVGGNVLRPADRAKQVSGAPGAEQPQRTGLRIGRIGTLLEDVQVTVQQPLRVVL